MGLILPAVYFQTLYGRTDLIMGPTDIETEAVKISRAVAIIFLLGYFIYVVYQTKSHDSLFSAIYQDDEHKDTDRHIDMFKPRLTMTEAILAIVIGIAVVSLIAVFLVLQIPFMVHDRHVSDAFVGLILIPLVEKIAGECCRKNAPATWPS